MQFNSYFNQLYLLVPSCTYVTHDKIRSGIKALEFFTILEKFGKDANFILSAILAVIILYAADMHYRTPQNAKTSRSSATIVFAKFDIAVKRNFQYRLVLAASVILFLFS